MNGASFGKFTAEDYRRMVARRPQQQSTRPPDRPPKVLSARELALAREAKPQTAVKKVGTFTDGGFGGKTARDRKRTKNSKKESRARSSYAEGLGGQADKAFGKTSERPERSSMESRKPMTEGLMVKVGSGDKAENPALHRSSGETREKKYAGSKGANRSPQQSSHPQQNSRKPTGSFRNADDQKYSAAIAPAPPFKSCNESEFTKTISSAAMKGDSQTVPIRKEFETALVIPDRPRSAYRAKSSRVETPSKAATGDIELSSRGLLSPESHQFAVALKERRQPTGNGETTVKKSPRMKAASVQEMEATGKGETTIKKSPRMKAASIQEMEATGKGETTIKKSPQKKAASIQEMQANGCCSRAGTAGLLEAESDVHMDRGRGGTSATTRRGKAVTFVEIEEGSASTSQSDTPEKSLSERHSTVGLEPQVVAPELDPLKLTNAIRLLITLVLQQRACLVSPPFIGRVMRDIMNNIGVLDEDVIRAIVVDAELLDTILRGRSLVDAAGPEAAENRRKWEYASKICLKCKQTPKSDSARGTALRSSSQPEKTEQTKKVAESSKIGSSETAIRKRQRSPESPEKTSKRVRSGESEAAKKEISGRVSEPRKEISSGSSTTGRKRRQRIPASEVANDVGTCVLSSGSREVVPPSIGEEVGSDSQVAADAHGGPSTNVDTIHDDVPDEAEDAPKPGVSIQRIEDALHLLHALCAAGVLEAFGLMDRRDWQ
ncbi:hypothetical protein HK104_010506 [Borealophlyctis nickersoniae]|nr:hypothetical protein HK104_010506 [Borealophlyctis nickersoniae]